MSDPLLLVAAALPVAFLAWAVCLVLGALREPTYDPHAGPPLLSSAELLRAADEYARRAATGQPPTPED